VIGWLNSHFFPPVSFQTEEKKTAAGDYYVQLLLTFATCFSHGMRLFLYEQSHLRWNARNEHGIEKQICEELNNNR